MKLMLMSLVFLCSLSTVVGSEATAEAKPLTEEMIKQGFRSSGTNKRDGREILIKENGAFSYRDDFERGIPYCKKCRAGISSK